MTKIIKGEILTITGRRFSDPPFLWAGTRDPPRSSHSRKAVGAADRAGRVLPEAVRADVVVASLSNFSRFFAEKCLRHFRREFRNRSVRFRLLVRTPGHSRHRIVETAADRLAFLRRYAIPTAVLAL